jgi:hypothetical protein
MDFYLTNSFKRFCKQNLGVFNQLCTVKISIWLHFTTTVGLGGIIICIASATIKSTSSAAKRIEKINCGSHTIIIFILTESFFAFIKRGIRSI